MTLAGLFRILTIAAAAFCLGTLMLLVLRTFGLGRRRDLSAPRGYAANGILYAFGRGMVEKESVALHLPTFIGGLVYHGAIFAGLLYLFWTVLFPKIRPPLWGLRLILLAGAVAGLSLFIKRAAKPHLRRLSCPDDFFANIFVNLFLIVALARTFIPALGPALMGISISLFLYIPLGKIRHCFFFFYTRLAFGFHYGRRGALPGSSGKA
jgi:hypothetical protein